MIKSKKSLGMQKVVKLQLDQKSVKAYIDNDGIISHNCKWCKRFYLDEDGSPKVYKLSTLLANGSNYGKAKEAWQPVTGATHPNTRTSQIIELKPGWKVTPGGSQTFIGMDEWNDYIVNKISG